MRIYIITPLINKSNFIPHLVEHCIGHSTLDMDKYFSLSYGVDGVINTDYTYYEYDKRINYKDAINILKTDISKTSFTYEKKIIQEELENITYNQRIYEYVVKNYIDKDFSINKYETVKRDNIKDYHNKYYIPKNMIAVNENYKVLYSGFSIKNTKNNKKNKITKKHFEFKNDKYQLYILQIINQKETERKL